MKPKEALTATNADEIKKTMRPARAQGFIVSEPANYGSLGSRERNASQSRRLRPIIRSRDADNIVGRIGGDQNIGHREDDKNGQRGFHPPRHNAPLDITDSCYSSRASKLWESSTGLFRAVASRSDLTHIESKCSAKGMRSAPRCSKLSPSRPR